MIPFFITVDTEGDALWDNPQNEDIRTENVTCIPRLQELCERYGFKPIWLTDYEIISDDRFVSYIKEKNKQGLCEVGIHVHARNNPPIIKLENEKESGAAYLIEYPEETMREKFLYLKELLETRLECKIITHRAGRWTVNDKYIDLLGEAGIRYDCSVTPGLSWHHLEGITPGSHGSDYGAYQYERQVLTSAHGPIIEYPVTVLDCKGFIAPDSLALKPVVRAVRGALRHTKLWLRPNTGSNLNQMKHVLRKIKDEELGYAEFMIHSSELMPGGGPKHQGAAEVDLLFGNMEKLFQYAKQLGYEGHTFDTWEKQGCAAK